MINILKRIDYTSWGCTLLAFGLYFNTLESGFVYDDRRAILTNPDVSGKAPIKDLLQNDFWGTPLVDSGSHGSFRPLCVLTYRLNYMLGAFTPWGYHFVNNLFHCLATYLVVKIARQLLSAYSGVLATGILFAIHPIHTEAVASIVGRADIGATIFCLLTFQCYLQHIKWRECGEQKQWLALFFVIILSALALLFKETAISALFLCGVFDIFRNFVNLTKDKQRIRSIGILIATTLCLLSYRLLMVPRPQTLFSTADNPIAKDKSIFTRFYTFMYLPVFNLKLMLYPNLLSFDWGMESIPKIQSIGDGRNFLSFILYFSLMVALTYCCRILTKRDSLENDGRFRGAKYIIKKQQQKQLQKQQKQQQQVQTTRQTTLPHNGQQQHHRKSRTKKKQKQSTAQPKVNNVATLPNNVAAIERRNSTAIMAQDLCFDCKQELVNDNHTSSCQLKNNNNIVANIYGDCCCQLLSTSDKNSKFYFSKLWNKFTSALFKSRRIRRNSASSSASSKKTNLTTDSSCNSLTSSNSAASSGTSISTDTSTVATTCERPSIQHHCNHQMMIQQVPMRNQNALVLLMCIGFLCFPYIPASNLFFYVGFVVAERLLYMPSIGFCLLFGMGYSKLHNKVRQMKKVKRRRIAKLIIFACVTIGTITLSMRTISRNTDWHNEENLFRSAIPVNPPKALGNLGSILSSMGRYEEAKVMLSEALKYRPNMADVHFNLGILHQNQNQFATAVQCFQRAIQFRPSLATAYLNMGISLMALGRFKEAAHIWQEGTRIDGRGVRDRVAHDHARVSSYLQLGSLYAEQNKLQRALAIYREALHAVPTSPNQRETLYQRIGDAFSRLHQTSDADKKQKMLLELESEQLSAQLSPGVTVTRNSSKASEAELWFKRAIKLAPDDPSVHQQYAEFLTALARTKEAIFYRVRAAELSPNDYSIIVTTATAFRMLDRNVEAKYWYKKAVALKPDDSRAHTNLGAILHILGENQEAASSYKTALRLDPFDTTTLANLAKLQNSRKL